jgi:anti-sigma factor RsiW
VVETDDRHADHDQLLIAALLDHELTGFERAVAESRISSCPRCAALHADLIALSSATRELPVPPRARDFRLTPADAARIAAATGEPVAAGPRLAGVMPDPRTAAPHAAHDTLLVAALADHSVAGREREAAEALVASCTECAALLTDLVALRTATQAMPTPARPRDYALTPDDVARLRPSGWRRFVAAFGTSHDTFSRPLAVGLTTLGLAGLLVATIPSILPTGSSAAAAPTLDAVAGAATGSGSSQEVGNGGGNLAPVPAASTGDTSVKGVAGPAAVPAVPAASAAGPAPVPTAIPDTAFGALHPDRTSPPPVAGGAAVGGAPAASPGSEPLTTQTAGRPSGTEADRATGPAPLVTLSGVLLVVGLGLFVIRWGARRFGNA